MGSKGHSRGRRTRPDPIKVLQGHVQPDILDLLALISEVNPTDRHLPKDEEKQRYRLKSQLQDLLIERFSQDLDVQAGPDDVVLILHRPSGLGSHARLSALGDEARLWARRHLDQPPEEEIPEVLEAPAPAERPERPPKEVSAGELVRRGLSALEEHDYEEAKGLLYRGVARSRGAVEAALPLVELLVDHLAAYSEALALAESLPPSTMTDPKVRALLGLAAARSGDALEADRLAHNLSGPRAEEVYRTLATEALRQGQLDEAALHLAAARQRGGLTLEIQLLEEEMTALVAERWRPEEEHLNQAFDRGRLAEAERLAQGLLELWPGSALAQRVLGQLERRRRDEEVGQILALAQEALASGDAGTTMALIKQAQALGADKRATEPLLAEAKALDTAEREGALVGRALEQLEKGDRAEALLAYLALEPSLRERIRHGRDDVALGWLEEASAPPSGSKARAAVEAVLALEEASIRLAEGPEEAHRLLLPHGRLLRDISHGRSLLERAAQGAWEIQQVRSRQALIQAREALKSFDLEETQRQLDIVDQRTLSPEEVEKARLLAWELRTYQGMLRLTTIIRSRMAKGDPLGAREALEELLAHADNPEACRPYMDQINAALRSNWALLAVEGEDLPLTPDLDGELDGQGSVILLPDGRAMLLLSTHGHWIFLWEVEVPSGRVRRALRLKLPVAVQGNAQAMVDGPDVYITSTMPCFALHLDRATGDIRQWIRPLDQMAGQPLHSMDLIPHPFVAWSLFTRENKEGKGESHEAVLVDMSRPQLARRIAGTCRKLAPVRGGPEIVTLMITHRRHASVFDPQGNLKLKATFPGPFNTMEGAAIDSQGQGFVLICNHLERGAHMRRVLVWLSPEGKVAGPFQINAMVSSILEVATALDKGLTFVLFRQLDERTMLMALRTPKGRALQEVYRVEVPSGTSLTYDQASQHVVARAPSNQGHQLLPLGETPPAFDLDIKAFFRLEEVFISWDRALSRCHPYGMESKQTRDEEFSFLRLPDEEQGPYLERKIKESNGKPERLMDLYRLVRHHPLHELRAWLLGRFKELYPDLAMLKLIEAEGVVQQGDWEGAVIILTTVARERLKESQLRHLYHLLGVAHWELGQDDEALECWRRGDTHTGSCVLNPLIGLATPLSADPQPEEWGPHKPLALQMKGAIRAADLCLERGDTQGAMATLRPFLAQGVRDMQLLARLAKAHLGQEATTDEEKLQKSLVLAKFHWGFQRGGGQSFYELPLRQGRWSRERLGEIAGEAARWLEESH